MKNRIKETVKALKAILLGAMVVTTVFLIMDFINRILPKLLELYERI